MNAQQRRQIAVFLVMTVALAAVALNGLLPTHPLTGAVRGGWGKLAAGAQAVVDPWGNGLVDKTPVAEKPTAEHSPTTVPQPSTGLRTSAGSTQNVVDSSGSRPGPHHASGDGGRHPGGHGKRPHHASAHGGRHHGGHGKGQGSKGGTHHRAPTSAARGDGDATNAAARGSRGHGGHARSQRAGSDWPGHGNASKTRSNSRGNGHARGQAFGHGHGKGHSHGHGHGQHRRR